MLERRAPVETAIGGDETSEAQAAPPVVETRLNRAAAVSLHVCALVLGVGALYFARDVFLPVALAVLAALTLSPIVRGLDRRGLPGWLTAPTLVVGLVGALGLGAYLLSYPLAEWLARAPEIGRELKWELYSLRSSLEAVEEATKQVDEIAQAGSAEPGVDEVVVREPGFLVTASSGLAGALATIGIASLLAIFLLAAGDRIYERIVHVLPTFHDKRTAVEIVRAIERSISRYLLTITLINTALGIGVGTALWAVGMPTPVLFGAMATLLNFLPYIGAILGVVITAAIALVTFDGLGPTLAPPLVYLAFTSLEGNVVTPLIVGRRLEINAVAILVGVAFMGWLWGAVGIFLAVPLLVVLKTICDHLPSWAGVGAFLAGSLTRPEREKGG